MFLNWMISNVCCILEVLVDLTQQLNTLDFKMQGSGQVITTAYESVKNVSTNQDFLRKSKLSAKKKPSVLFLHADLWWNREQHSVGTNMALLLRTW